MVKIEITGDSAREALTDLHEMAAATQSRNPQPHSAPATAPVQPQPAVNIAPMVAPPTASPVPAPVNPTPAVVPPVQTATPPTGTYSAPPVQAPITVAPTAPAPSFTVEQVGKAGADLIAANPAKMSGLLGLLQQYNVPAITELKPDQLGPFATALRGLGAKL